MGMEVDTAITIINEQLVYLPGWQINAESFTRRFEDTIRVEVEYPAVATDRDEARQGYPKLITTGGHWPLGLHHCNDDTALMLAMLQNILIPIHIHEARESLRVKPSFWAPYHPHRMDGMERWGDPQGDMMFGLA